MCNNEDKAARRPILIRPRVQAEMLQAVRKQPMHPLDFIEHFKKQNRNAVFRLANVGKY